MAISFEAFFYGIQSIESGGNYKAVGPVVKGNRAYGKYQVMDFNIPKWTKQYLGYSMTPQQFLNSPDAQEKVARGVLQGYYNQYGPDGAAAMWFSGQSDPNSSKSDGYNTVKKYVAKMRDAAAKYSGGGGMPSGSGVSGGLAKGIGIDQSVLAEEYGLVKQLIDSVPELKKLFDLAVKEGWEAKKFQARLANTTWWQSHSEKQRQYLIKSFTDPASFREDRENAMFRINELGAQLGLPGIIGDNVMLQQLITGLLYEGWSDAELKFQIGARMMLQADGTLAGQGGEFQNKMTTMAWSNGVKLDANWYLTKYRGILQGTMTEQQAQQEIRNKAAAMFPGFKDQIMAGQNMIDIASPYLQGMSSILEVNPGTLDLFDPTITGALNYKDSKGVTGAKPLWMFETELRKDPRWVKTNNAREGLMGVAHKVAQDFGVLF